MDLEMMRRLRLQYLSSPVGQARGAASAVPPPADAIELSAAVPVHPVSVQPAGDPALVQQPAIPVEQEAVSVQPAGDSALVQQPAIPVEQEAVSVQPAGDPAVVQQPAIPVEREASGAAPPNSSLQLALHASRTQGLLDAPAMLGQPVFVCLPFREMAGFLSNILGPPRQNTCTLQEVSDNGTQHFSPPSTASHHEQSERIGSDGSSSAISQPPGNWTGRSGDASSTSHQHESDRRRSDGPSSATSQPPRSWTARSGDTSSSSHQHQADRRRSDGSSSATSQPPGSWTARSVGSSPSSHQHQSDKRRSDGPSSATSEPPGSWTARSGDESSSSHQHQSEGMQSDGQPSAPEFSQDWIRSISPALSDFWLPPPSPPIEPSTSQEKPPQNSRPGGRVFTADDFVLLSDTDDEAQDVEEQEVAENEDAEGAVYFKQTPQGLVPVKVSDVKKPKKFKTKMKAKKRPLEQPSEEEDDPDFMPAKKAKKTEPAKKRGRPKGSKNKPKTEKTDDDSDEGGRRVSCKICHSYSGKMVMTTCGHVFHASCLNRWNDVSGQKLFKKKKCPFCCSLFVDTFQFFG